MSITPVPSVPSRFQLPDHMPWKRTENPTGGPYPIPPGTPGLLQEVLLGSLN